VNPLPERRSPRQWVALAAVVLVLAISCVGLGRWQWHRYAVRSAEIERIDTNYAASPVALDDVLAPSGTLAEADVWRQVRLTGHYLADATVLLRNRPVGGGAGFHVLAPFVDDASGATIVVDRGFLPGLEAPAPDAVPQPPTGEVTVVAHLRQDEPASRRSPVPGQVHAISTAQVLARGGAGTGAVRTVHAYGVLASETPSGADAPATLPPPSTDPGSHLSYAFQWWVFALGLVAMFVVLFRRDRLSRRVSIDDILASAATGAVVQAGAGAQAAATAKARRRRENDEAALEDDLIESQLTR